MDFLNRLAAIRYKFLALASSTSNTGFQSSIVFWGDLFEVHVIFLISLSFNK